MTQLATCPVIVGYYHAKMKAIFPPAWRLAAVFAILFGFVFVAPRVGACCAVTREKGAVVNADQTVILMWDVARQRQHFIRRASFKTDAADVGFIVPSPSRPELAESGDDAFQRLAEMTAPRVKAGFSFPLGCSATLPSAGYKGSVRVIEEKRVAGFDATVLTADTGADLTEWLKKHGYAFSPHVAEWAQPYLGGGWHFTALKLVKADIGHDIKSGALRLSFQTDRPLFPYREPESAAAAAKLATSGRMLRVYFIAERRYRGEVAGRNWSGEAVWSGDITNSRATLLQDLKLPPSAGPANWWLTEFEDRWPYQKAAGDVYFSIDSNQRAKSRPDIAARGGHDLALIGFVGLGLLRPAIRRRRRGGGCGGRRCPGR